MNYQKILPLALGALLLCSFNNGSFASTTLSKQSVSPLTTVQSPVYRVLESILTKVMSLGTLAELENIAIYRTRAIALRTTLYGNTQNVSRSTIRGILNLGDDIVKDVVKKGVFNSEAEKLAIENISNLIKNTRSLYL